MMLGLVPQSTLPKKDITWVSPHHLFQPILHTYKIDCTVGQNAYSTHPLKMALHPERQQCPLIADNCTLRKWHFSSDTGH